MSIYTLIFLCSVVNITVCNKWIENEGNSENLKTRTHSRGHLVRRYPSKLLNVKRELYGKNSIVPRKVRNGDSVATREMSKEFMLHLYNNLQRGQGLVSASGHKRSTRGVTNSDTVRTVSATDKTTNRHEYVLQFYVPKLPEVEKLLQAELRFRSRTSGKITITVKKGSSVIRKFLLLQKPVSIDSEITFDVTKQLSPWINGFHGNVTIEIRKGVFPLKHSSVPKPEAKYSNFVRNEKEKEVILILFSKDSDFLKKLFKGMKSKNIRNVSKQTMSDITGDDTSISEHFLSRQKRASKQRRQTKKRLSNKTGRRQRMCQVRDFEVDFNHIGWGQWIVIPKRFNAKMCRGSCPAPIAADLTPTNHALLQSLMRVGKRKNRPPMPCCIPTKFKPLSMLYYEQNEIVVRYHGDMIVEECGCR